MSFNQNTLRIIANGDFMPDQEYVKEMARALLNTVLVYPRCDRAMRDDGKPFYYDIAKGGTVRGEIYHAWFTNTFVVEIPGFTWENGYDFGSFKSLEEAENAAKEKLKNC
uniref:Phage protein n=1 Tax=Salmonella phage vB_SEnST11_KE23 TaxID=3161174 RepID=A0AAU8GF42_9CAUD